jgi:hypothetical protein
MHANVPISAPRAYRYDHTDGVLTFVEYTRTNVQRSKCVDIRRARCVRAASISHHDQADSDMMSARRWHMHADVAVCNTRQDRAETIANNASTHMLELPSN